MGRNRFSPMCACSRQHLTAVRWRCQHFWNYLFPVFRRTQTHAINAAPLVCVTICRELRYSDQTIKPEHVGTDRRRKAPTLCTRPPPAWPTWGRGRFSPTCACSRQHLTPPAQLRSSSRSRPTRQLSAGAAIAPSPHQRRRHPKPAPDSSAATRAKG